jgi:hypothetical protein
MLTIGQQADLRQVCFDFLAIRFPNAYEADAIARMITRRQRVDYPVSANDVTVAVRFLQGEGLAEPSLGPLAVSPSWAATSKGLAQYQRARVAADPREGEV